MNGNDLIFDDDCQQMHNQWQQEMQQMEEYYEQQQSLPPHKRDGYAERMAEEADMRRKALREEMK